MRSDRSHAPTVRTHAFQKTEIAELEALRRDLREREWESGGSSAPPSKEKKSRLPPGPFAGINAAGDDRPQQAATTYPEDDDGAEYTRDGLRLASPKRQVQAAKPAAAMSVDQQQPAAASEAKPTGGQQAAPSALGDADLFADGAAGDVTTMVGLIKASMDGREREDDDGAEEDDGGDGGFDWEEGYEDMEGQVAAATAAAAARLSPAEAAASGASSEAEEGGQEHALPMVEAPAGGYPKRLAGLMSFCRVSDKATCEILVEMGRVTVNGEVAKDPGIKVDLLTDIVVANGEKNYCCECFFSCVVRKSFPSTGGMERCDNLFWFLVHDFGFGFVRTFCLYLWRV